MRLAGKTAINTGSGRGIGQAIALKLADEGASVVVNTCGGLDIVVNNAGYTWDSAIQNTADDQWRAMLDIHLTAPLRLLRSAAPFMCGAAKRESGRRNTGHPQGRPCVVGSRYGRQGRSIRLLRRHGCHWSHQDAGQGVEPVSDYRQHCGLRTDQGWHWELTARGNGARTPDRACWDAYRRRQRGLPLLHPRVRLRHPSTRRLRRRTSLVRLLGSPFC